MKISLVTIFLFQFWLTSGELSFFEEQQLLSCQLCQEQLVFRTAEMQYLKLLERICGGRVTECYEREFAIFRTQKMLIEKHGFTPKLACKTVGGHCLFEEIK
ncbi:unnamed protein product [Caenorhabditis angaria]|uniref:Saposin B-type domain-containing protein n=1 Tax=Caenorhabditis angaria TaxID=860376 RepID=A0A9P1MU37_9PELO|nr:unnamed protein product [Caenorhabditis angaria]